LRKHILKISRSSRGSCTISIGRILRECGAEGWSYAVARVLERSENRIVLELRRFEP